MTAKQWFNTSCYVALALALLYITQCTHRGTCPQASPTPPVTTRDTTRIHDTTTRYINVPKPYPVASKPDTIPVHVDTAAILAAYFTTNSYSIPADDSDIKATMFDTVAFNKLVSAKLKYQIIKPMTTIVNTTNVISPNKLKAYIGILVGGNTEQLNQVSAKLTFIPKNDNYLYEIGDNVLIKQPNIEVGIGWKIHFHLLE